MVFEGHKVGVAGSRPDEGVPENVLVARGVGDVHAGGIGEAVIARQPRRLRDPSGERN